MEKWEIFPVLASSGKQALDILGKEDGFDLVLTDYQMPEMDGNQVSQHIKNQFPFLPIILLSSAGDGQEKCQKELYTSMLTKPVKQHILAKSIGNALRTTQLPITEALHTGDIIPANFALMHPMNILVAEDNLFNQQVILGILEMMGYSADLAENGAEAVAMATFKSYDVILMDMQMPELNGIQATEEIRRTLTSQPVIIAMTANVLQEDREACTLAGMNDHIGKPFNFEDLIDKLSALYSGAIQPVTSQLVNKSRP
jgi:two-component system, sensor histidine kinase and response regulator